MGSKAPIAIQRLPRKCCTQAVAHCAVSAIAPEQPVRRHRVLAPVGMPQHGFNAVRVPLERHEFHQALNRDTQAGKPFFKQAFGLRLWEQKSIGIGTLGTLHADAADDLVGGDNVNRLGLEASINERGRAATPVRGCGSR
jgi:hypothetical protein